MKLPVSLLVVANVVPLIGLLASPILCFVSLFFFDSPGSIGNPLVIGMAIAVWTYPITAGLGGFFALKAYKASDFRRMLTWTICTYSSIGLFFVCMAIGALVELAA